MGKDIVQVSTKKGCPQEGVLSSDKLLEGLSVDPQCRAHLSWVWDDIDIIARGQFEGTLYDLVQERGEIPKKDSAMRLD